jgi:hypothetical protein
LTEAGGVIFLPQILCVYRKHAEQAAQTSNVDGLCDVLDLWRWKEYAHWPASKVAELVLTQLGATARSGQSFRAVLKNVRQRGLTWRVLKGMPEALLMKVRRRAFSTNAAGDAGYASPVDPENAILAARIALASMEAENQARTAPADRHDVLLVREPQK